MDGEIWLLWYRDAYSMTPHWTLHGVFLTQSIATRRRDQMEMQDGGKWVVQRREIGVLGEQEIN